MPKNNNYTGEYRNGMRHGFGLQSWENGEVYEGEFYKDYPHGNGKYSWKDGSLYCGRFYLGKKDGYGKLTFANSDYFIGLYKNGERFGPGVYFYHKSKKQDIGIWHREKMIQVITPMKDIFTLDNHPEYEHFTEDNVCYLDMEDDSILTIDFTEMSAEKSSEILFAMRGLQNTMLLEENTLPDGIEKYSEDYEHLPLTEQFKQQFDIAYFKEEYDLIKNDSDALIVATNNTPLLMQIQKNIYKHRHQKTDEFDNEILKKIPLSVRDDFSYIKGQIELTSEELIRAASTGDGKLVYSCLKSCSINPNVCDKTGITALFAAAINCHREIVNLLLDMGANVDHITSEGLTALSACHIFYYPVDHFRHNIAEESVEKHRDLLKSQKTAKHKKSKTKSKKKPTINARRKGLHGGTLNIFVTPNLRNVSPPSSPKTKLKSRKTSAKSDIASLAKLTDIREMDKNDAMIYCKSDVKIKALHRELSSSRCEERPNFSDEELSRPTTASFDIETNSTKSMHSVDSLTTSSSMQLSKLSHINMVEYDIVVPDELIEHTATLLSFNKRAVSGMSTRDGRAISLGTTGALAVWKAEHQELREMIKLLLKRGASPNKSSVPLHPLFFAIKAGDIEAVKFLLENGANTSTKMPLHLGGFQPLHLSCAVPGHESVAITDLLLKAGANPNVYADDQDIVIDDSTTKSSDISTQSSIMADKPSDYTQWLTIGLKYVEEKGRTPLHIVCDRDDNYKDSCKIVHLLLDAGANPDVIWSGHSPLSLAIKSGNDSAVDEIVEFDGDASLPLQRGVGSALCACVNPAYEHRRTPENQIKLINKLIEAEANILAPIVFGGVKQMTGTVVDYAHWIFNKDLRIAHSPYHALTLQERDTYNARKALLIHLGSLLREAALKVNRLMLQKEKNFGIRSQSPSRGSRFLFTGAGAKPATPQSNQLQAPGNPMENYQYSPKEKEIMESLSVSQTYQTNSHLNIGKSHPIKGRTGTGPIRKPLFRYCYECGRSVGVRLTPCSRCHEVYYCSRSCKLRAWDDRHKKECLRQKTKTEPVSPSPTEVASYYTTRTLKDTLNPSNVTEREKRKRAKSSRKVSSYFPDIYSTDSPRSSPMRSIKSAKTLGSTQSNLTSYQRANIGKKLQQKVGKSVIFGSTGMTLRELGITENYTFI